MVHVQIHHPNLNEMDFAFKAEDKKKESVDVEPQLTMPEAALNEKEDGGQQPVDEPCHSLREHRPPVRFWVDEFADVARADHVVYQIEEPSMIGEALSSECSRQWKEDADSEFEALMDNETWELVDLPEGREAIWLRRMLTELGASPGCAILIPGAIALAKNPAAHARTKHITRTFVKQFKMERLTCSTAQFRKSYVRSYE